MPSKKICRCGKLIDIEEGLCAKCKQRKETAEHERDKNRGSSNERGYTSRWRVYRALYLKQNPLCVECMKEYKYVPATVVDHIIPHKGDKKLFWDKNNHQTLCKHCHDVKTAREDGGFGNIRGL